MDCANCNSNIDNEEIIEEFITTLVNDLDMKRIGRPIIKRVDSEEEGRGVSAVQLITTSTITAHFDDDGNDAYIDVFSCKKYDPKVVLKCIEEYFEPEQTGAFWLFRDAGRFDP